MLEVERKTTKIGRFAANIDGLANAISPKWGYNRKKFRFAYDAVDGSRTRKKRVNLGGTGDSHLSEQTLYKLREIHREMMRNNPLVNGLLKTERDGLIGSGVKIKGRTQDKVLNKKLELLWQKEMIDRACDVTGRFNFNQYLRTAFLSCRRDGDVGTIFAENGLQGIEGDQIGTPMGKTSAKLFDVVNGVAVSKTTKKLLGYYVGIPDKYGFINPAGYKKYSTDDMHLMFSPDRFSQSRGEPALTSSIDYIDKLCSYYDAELVAAKVNACFTMFVSHKDEFGGAPNPYTDGISSSGVNEDGARLEKMEPGTILYGDSGENAAGIGQTRPGNQFVPFIQQSLTMIGRPLLMPLMLITLDFSGATFMNARIAYQECRASWQNTQDVVVKPFVSRVWKHKVKEWIKRGLVTASDDIYNHEIGCKRWPYVDPLKEANADARELKSRTNTRDLICDRKGLDFDDVNNQLIKEDAAIPVAEPQVKEAS